MSLKFIQLKKKILLTAVITAVISVFISFIAFYFIFLSDSRYLKLKQLDYLVENYFYGEIDTTKINDMLIRGYIAGLDDNYANYFSVEETEERTKDLQGKGQGIGVIVVKHPDSENIFIRNVYENGPAFKAGIKEGDQIIAVDGKLTEEATYSVSVDSMLKQVGEKMTLTILREEQTFEVQVTCSEFAAQTVFAKLIDGYGYVKITAFNGETTIQFENAVNRLVSGGAKALIFDLRSNGGGTVDSVCEMVDFLCPKGDVMTVKYANGKTEVLGKSDSSEIDLNMVVLTDGGTASASELFTASIKDFDKGISIGEKTFGKGVMQTTYRFTDGSSVAFTVAEFFAHGGDSFNGKGIAPDIKCTLTEEEKKFNLTAPTEQDLVVKAALEYLNDNEK